MNRPELWGVYGRRNSGKSTLAIALAARHRRLVVFDPMSDWQRVKGVATVRSRRALRDRMAASWGEGFRLAYVPPAGDEVAALHALALLLLACQWPYFARRDRRELLLVIDEANLGFPVHALPADQRGMYRVVNQGRHFGIGAIGISQRPAALSPHFRGNAARVYSFPLTRESDKREVIGTIGRRHAAALDGLKPHNFLKWVETAPDQVTAGRISKGGIITPRAAGA